jgi:hypothetical protein
MEEISSSERVTLSLMQLRPKAINSKERRRVHPAKAMLKIISNAGVY